MHTEANRNCLPLSALEPLSALTALQSLELICQIHSGDQRLSALWTAPHLTRLGLSHCQLELSACTAISELPAIIDLDLRQCTPLTGAQMQPLSTLTRLTSLTVTAKPAAGESGLWQQAFLGLCNLVSLELSIDCEPGLPFPITALGALPALRDLFIGAAPWCQNRALLNKLDLRCLRSLRGLQRFVLDFDLFHFDLDELRLKVCDYSNAATVLPAPDMCPSVVGVTIHIKDYSHHDNLPACDVAWVCKLTALTSLILPRKAAVSAAALAGLCELSTLSADVTDSHACFASLGALSKLRELDLTVDGRADSMACSPLPTTLSRLQLYARASLRIHDLAQHTQLVDLRLHSCCVDDSQLQALGRLTWLQLHKCSGATGSCLEGLAQLQQLVLTDCPAVTSQTLSHLPGLRRLRGILLACPGLGDTIFKLLRAVPQLCRIHLRSQCLLTSSVVCPFTSAAVEELMLPRPPPHLVELEVPAGCISLDWKRRAYQNVFYLGEQDEYGNVLLKPHFPGRRRVVHNHKTTSLERMGCLGLYCSRFFP